MRWVALCLLSAVTACDAPPSSGASLPDGTSCELQRPVSPEGRRVLDLLVVVDRSPVMAAYREALLFNLPRFVNVVENIEGGLPDLHLGVVAADLGSAAGCTGDGALSTAPQVSGCIPPDGAFATDEVGLWYVCGDDPHGRCGERNYSGELADAVTCIGALETGSCTSRQPLAAAAEVIANDHAGFIRPDGYLMVLILSAGDDDSPGTIEDYTLAFKGAKTDPRAVLVSAVVPTDATRTRAFAELFPFRNTVVDVDESDWSDAMALAAGLYRVTLGFPCLDAEFVDRDPGNRGMQPECVVVTDEGANLPACTMLTETRPSPETARPCWWLEDYGETGCPYVPHVEGNAPTDWRCATVCPLTGP